VTGTVQFTDSNSLTRGFSLTPGALAPRGELVTLYRQAGLQPGQRVITCCGAGYYGYGALNLFVLHQLGYEDRWFALFANSARLACLAAEADPVSE
jgi:3-mercaptopyruvate sulfurtransferase SseA